MPSEAVMSAALAEIYKITRPDRISIHPNYGSPSMIRTSNNVTVEAFNRLANYLYLKTGSKAEIPLAPQAATALDKAKSAAKSGAPTMALMLATQYDIPMFHVRATKKLRRLSDNRSGRFRLNMAAKFQSI